MRFLPFHDRIYVSLTNCNKKVQAAGEAAAENEDKHAWPIMQIMHKCGEFAGQMEKKCQFITHQSI